MTEEEFKLKVVDALARIETKQEICADDRVRINDLEDEVVEVKLDVAGAKKKTTLLATAITSVGVAIAAAFRS